MYVLYNIIRYNYIVIVRKIYLIYKNEFLISISTVFKHICKNS